MGNRGRKSAASLSVVSADNEVEVVRRPEAPQDLTDEQAEEWRLIVETMPADWFPWETHALLAQYCRHVVAARRVGQLISAFDEADEIDVEEYDRLLKMQEREGRAMSSLATRMRITQQSSYDPKKKKTRPAPRPWDA